MKLHLPSDGGVTIIENEFIDQYMPEANGEFVKVYLYMLRCAGTGIELSLSSIADIFNHTERDVRRALTYWEKLHLLKLEYDGKGKLSDILFLSGNQDPASGQEHGTVSSSVAPAAAGPQECPSEQTDPVPGQDLREPRKAAAVRPSTQLSPSRRKELMEQEEVKEMIYVAEKYCSRPLTPTESRDLLYFYDKLGFSADLVDYLVEYCVSRNKFGSAYMNKVAEGWVNEGISSVAQAKQAAGLYNRRYFSVFRCLGIRSHEPTPAEAEYIDRWYTEYGFETDIVEEACRRTILQAHEPSFEYAERILNKWHKVGVRSMDQIRTLDQDHSARSRKPAAAPAPAPNRFTGIPQRKYNWSKLEQQLLNIPDAGGKEG